MASKPKKRKASSKDDGDAEDYLSRTKKKKDSVDDDDDDDETASGSPFKYTQPVVSRFTGRIRKKSSKLREMEEDAIADAEEMEQLEEHKANVNVSKKKTMKSEPTSPIASMGNPIESLVAAKSPKKSKSAPVVQGASPGKEDESMIKLLLTSPGPSVATLETDATKSTTKKSKSAQLQEMMQPQDVETPSDNTSGIKMKIHLGSDPGVETVVASPEPKPKKAPKKTPKKKKDVTAEVETDPGMAIEPMDESLVIATPPPKSAKKPAKPKTPKAPKTPKVPKKELIESGESELELGGSVFASEAVSPVKAAKTPKVKKPKAPKKPKKGAVPEMESITVERCFDEPEDEIPVHEVVLPSMLHDEDESETVETTLETAGDTVESEPIEEESDGSFLGGSPEVKPIFKLPKEPKPKKAKTPKVPKVNKKVKIEEDAGSSEEMLSQDSPQQFECLKSGEVVKRKGKQQSASKKKRRRRSGPTAYMLYCKSIRGRIQEQKPDLDFATTSKMLGERWHGLPEKEKVNWKRKAKRICKKTLEQNMQQVVKKSNENQYIKAHGKRYGTMTKRQLTGHIKGMASHVSGALELGASMSKATGTNPVDGAAHLKLLGDSLTLIGTRLIDHKGFIAVQGSLSVLLDSLISALGPLTCLTKQLDETNGCTEEQLSEILDNIAYVMPGL